MLLPGLVTDHPRPTTSRGKGRGVLVAETSDVCCWQGSYVENRQASQPLPE